MIKTQLCGPTTLSGFAGLNPLEAIEWCATVARATIEHVEASGRKCLLFIDEPGLAVREAVELERVVEACGGAVAVGLHSCGNTDWDRVLSWPFDLVSLDVRLSLDALLESPSVKGFVQRGGAFAFGVIPTRPDPGYAVSELCESIEAGLRAIVGEPQAVLQRSLLTPACGLGLATPERTSTVFAELAEAQALLRRNGQTT